MKRGNFETLALGARRAMRAAAALPALFSSMKLMVELMIRRVIIPTKSCQSGGFPCSRKQFAETPTGKTPSVTRRRSIIASIRQKH